MKFNLKDVKIEYYEPNNYLNHNDKIRAPAIKATHIPTGIAVGCFMERTSEKNQNRAIRELEKEVNIFYGI